MMGENYTYKVYLFFASYEVGLTRMDLGYDLESYYEATFGAHLRCLTTHLLVTIIAAITQSLA